MVIQHNMHAMFSNRQLGITSSDKAKSQEKLSSGYKINRAADNAAGLSISEKMRRQVRGVHRASVNARDGISLVQIADGALNEVHDMLQRGNELSVQAANGTNSESDRQAINEEIVQLKKEINAITSRTKYNEMEIFPKTGEWPRLDEINPNYETKQAIQSLAEKIAEEYVPNAVEQILTRIPVLGSAMDALVAAKGKEAYDMKLNVEYYDGVSKTLAFVQAGFHPHTSGPDTFADGSLMMLVDKDDFPSLNLSAEQEQMLESTIAHEMMHGVMDAVYPTRMCRSDPLRQEDFPKWFVEGTAQLTGGGFTTGWNDTLHRITGTLSGADDTSRDADIVSYLKNPDPTHTYYDVDTRVYGHGYLAAAYASYLAADGNDVSQSNLLDGANKIFGELLKDPMASFDSVLHSVTGVSVSDLKSAINNGKATSQKSGKMDALAFVRQLSYKSLGGAGSLVTDALNTGGNRILGNTAKKEDQPIRISNVAASYYALTDDAYKGSARVKLHIGADAENGMELKRFSMSTAALGLTETNVLSADLATAAINDFGYAIRLVSRVRSYYGAIQNRLEHTIANLDNVEENTTAAESLIRDTDMAKEISRFAKHSILEQAGQSMLTQANQSANGVMSLLQ